jgi:hypothetical protein
VSTYGTNVNSAAAKQFALYALAERDPAEPWPAEATTVLRADAYEAFLHAEVKKSKRISRIGEIATYVKMGGTASFVIPYVVNDYARFQNPLGLWAGSPRGTHRGVVFTRDSSTGAPVYLIDKREAPYLEPEERILPAANVVHIGAQAGESCLDACVRTGSGRCEDSELWFAQDCDLLQSVFACEAGCGFEIGNEIPCYVSDASKVTFRQCLVTDLTQPSCLAKHPSTQRLCPCVK